MSRVYFGVGISLDGHIAGSNRCPAKAWYACAS